MNTQRTPLTAEQRPNDTNMLLCYGLMGAIGEVYVDKKDASLASEQKKTAAFIVRAVNAHHLLLEVAKEVIKEAGDCSCEGYKCLFCFAQEAIVAAEGRAA